MKTNDIALIRVRQCRSTNVYRAIEIQSRFSRYCTMVIEMLKVFCSYLYSSRNLQTINTLLTY